ncbi:MAG: VPLPA-CTERM sorting domain-containing protein [Rhodovulum sp.]
MDLDYVGQEKGAAGTSFRFDGTDIAASAGEFTFDIVGTGRQLLGWCVDIAQTLIQTPTPYAEAPDLLEGPVVENLDRLFTQHYADVVDWVSSAAFQVAIWEIVYDSADIDLSSGRFSLRDQTPDRVDTMAADFLNLDASAGGYLLSFLRSEASPVPSQNLVTVAPVPLPASAGLMLAGFAFLGAARRRGGA